MLFFAHLFKVRYTLPALVQKVTVMMSQDLHVFEEKRPNERCGQLSKKSLKVDSSAFFFLKSTHNMTNHHHPDSFDIFIFCVSLFNWF